MKPVYDEESDYMEDYENGTYEEAADTELPEEDMDDYAYTDEDHFDDDDVSEKSSEKGKRQKSPEWIAREKQFMELYEEYMHPTKDYSACRVSWQRDDLLSLLREMNRGWAYSKANSYKRSGHYEADAELVLSIGFDYVYELLKKDRDTDNYCPYPIGHYLRIARRKSIDGYFRGDYFRDKLGRLPSRKKKDKNQNREEPTADELNPRKKQLPRFISLDQPWENSEIRHQGERLADASVNPFEDPRRPRKERDEFSNRLQIMYLRELMDYQDDPPKPLAVMYGNILFQLYKEYGGGDPLSVIAKKSTKGSSPEWAHKRMGKANLLQLSAYSERAVQRCIDKSLVWGSNFNRCMAERASVGAPKRWADIVYTDTFTVGNTSNWIESIMVSTMTKCSRKMFDSPELREYALEIFGAKSKFRKVLEKMEKEANR